MSSQPQRIIATITWGRSVGSKDTVSTTEFEMSETTRFEIPDAGRVSISARIIEPAKTDAEKRRLRHLDILAKARRGEVPTFPMPWSTDMVLLDEGTREIRVQDGRVSPGCVEHLGGCSSIPCLVVGMDVELVDGASQFEIEQVTIGRQTLLGGSLLASSFSGTPWKERAPFGGAYLYAGAYFRVTVRNFTDFPASIRGVLHVVDLCEFE